MEMSKAERLENAAATLNDLIAHVSAAGLNETAQFLAMAKLNLLIEANGVTGDEFRALCLVLERGTAARGKRRVRPSSLRAGHVEMPEDAAGAPRTTTRAGRPGIGPRRARARHAVASRRVSRAIN